MSKGGGGGGAQESTVVQTNLPEYAQPFYEELLGRTVYESTRPYETFPGQRMAEFTDYETRGMQGMSDLAAAGDPAQSRAAADIAGSVGDQGVDAGATIAGAFDPSGQTSEYVAGDIGSGYTAGGLGQGYEARQRESGYQAGSFDPMYSARDLQSGYTGNVDLGPGFEAGTIADPATLEKYTNPYQQLVTDIEKREAQRQSDIQGANISQQAAQSGGLGGYREAIMQSERGKNLDQQLADIQARGGQAGFEQAQKAFEADRAARLQEATYGLSAAGQADKSRQQAEEFKQRAFSVAEDARQKAASMGMTAQQQEDAARQAAEKFNQATFSQNEQGRMAQQQEERAVFQATEAARQEAARLGLNAQEVQERVNQAQNDARMRARQENIALAETRSRLGFMGLDADRAAQGQRLDAARLLGQLGTDDQRMAYERMRNLQAAGQNQRDLSQRGMDMGYQDFLRQQAFGREQLGFFSNMLQGLPVSPGSQTTTFGGPSDTQQLLGAGLGGVGLYRATNQ